MSQLIGELLPLGVGVAISPLPIIAVILMLLSPAAKRTGVAFAAGWVIGVVAAVTVFTLVGSLIPESDPDAGKPVSGVFHLLFGALLLFLGVSQFRDRPAPGTDPALPKWMRAIDTMGVAPALGLGLLLAAVNPKNTMMAATAGVDAGTAGLSVAATAGALTVYALIAVSTVVLPLVAYLLAAGRLARPLASIRLWLVAENATIMAVLLLVLGVTNIGKGIGSF